MTISPSHVSTTESPTKGAVQQTEKTKENLVLRDAMYSLEMKTFSRGKNDNVIVRIAYRGGYRKTTETGVLLADYTNKSGIVHKQIVLPEKHPLWANQSDPLWNEAVKRETRKNSVEGREIRMTIPYPLDFPDAKKVSLQFATEFVQEHGCAVEFFIHKDKHLNYKGEIKNEGGYHVHMMFTTRRLTEQGFTEKTRELDVQSAGYLNFWRQRWQEIANKALEENGRAERIDCRSYRDRGIAKQPTTPMMPSEVRRNRYAAEAARKEVTAAGKLRVAPV